jgi:rSAM/selenodomain-associated transferase 1
MSFIETSSVETPSVAVAIICKTPRPGHSKTRLSPPLRPEECAAISACFIQDLTGTIASVAGDGRAAGYAVYTPAGTETELRALLPADFGLVLQGGGDLGARLDQGIRDLLAAGHAGAIVINSDSPTLPRAILDAAVAAVLSGDNAVLSPALDGGYTLIGLSRPHPHLFEDIPWSTDVVYELTLQRACEIRLPVIALPGWYDVDDGASYAMLERELNGTHPPCATGPLQDAPKTRAFVRRRSDIMVRA